MGVFAMPADVLWGSNLHGLPLVVVVVSYAQRCASGGGTWGALDVVVGAAFVCGVGSGTAAALFIDKRAQWPLRGVLLVVRLCVGMFVWFFTASAVLVEVDPERLWAGVVIAPAVIFSLLCLRVGNGRVAAGCSLMLFAAALVLFVVQAFLASDAMARAAPARFACGSSGTGFAVFSLAASLFFGVSAIGDFHCCLHDQRREQSFVPGTVVRCVLAWTLGLCMLACARASDLLFRVQLANEDAARGLSGAEYALLSVIGCCSLAECCGVSHRLWETLLSQSVLLCGEPPQWSVDGVWAGRENVPGPLVALERRMQDFDARTRFARVFETAAMLLCGCAFFALVALSDRFAFEWLLYVMCGGSACAVLALLLAGGMRAEPPAAAPRAEPPVPVTRAHALMGGFRGRVSGARV